MKRPEEIAAKVVGEWGEGYHYSRQDELRQTVASAIRQDRDSRPTVPGAPLSEERLEEIYRARRLYEQARETWQSVSPNPVGCVIDLLTHLDFLTTLLVDDRLADTAARELGRQEGLEQAARVLDVKHESYRYRTDVQTTVSALAEKIRALKRD